MAETYQSRMDRPDAVILGTPPENTIIEIKELTNNGQDIFPFSPEMHYEFHNFLHQI